MTKTLKIAKPEIEEDKELTGILTLLVTKLVLPCWLSVAGYLPRLKRDIPTDLAIPPFDIYPTERCVRYRMLS